MPAHCEGRIKMWGLSEPTGMLADQAQAGSIAVSLPLPKMLVNAL